MICDDSISADERSGEPACPVGEGVGRREFLTGLCRVAGAAVPMTVGMIKVGDLLGQDDGGSERVYGMGIDIEKCIGCGRCAQACKTENDVPLEEHYFNTWVERYIMHSDEEVEVDSPNGGIDGFPPTESEHDLLKAFFVPKLCNHCDEAPCVQVCPVGATFRTNDGVVLVDEDYCVGCRYCIQACPYGARYLHPEKHVASKCTFCYHRLQRGLLPACVEVCPTGARIFGEVEGRASPLNRFKRFNTIQVLKPHLNTRPKVFYANLEGEVR